MMMMMMMMIIHRLVPLHQSYLYYCKSDGVSRGRRMSSGPTLLPVDLRVTDEADFCGKLLAAVVACEESCI